MKLEQKLGSNLPYPARNYDFNKGQLEAGDRLRVPHHVHAGCGQKADIGLGR